MIRKNTLSRVSKHDSTPALQNSCVLAVFPFYRFIDGSNANDESLGTALLHSIRGLEDIFQCWRVGFDLVTRRSKTGSFAIDPFLIISFVDHLLMIEKSGCLI